MQAVPLILHSGDLYEYRGILERALEKSGLDECKWVQTDSWASMLDGDGPTTSTASCLAVGRSTLEGLCGKAFVKQVLATRGGTNRASWEGYCYERGVEIPANRLPESVKWVVACPHPSTIAKMGFRNYAALQTAIRTFKVVLEGAEPLRYPKLESIEKVLENGSQIALDVETPGGAIGRIGLSSQNGDTCSIDWTKQIRVKLLEQMVWPACRFLAHNAPFDCGTLEDDRIPVNWLTWTDTMLTHMLLYPDARKGLGHAVPYYIATTPWKHTEHEEADWYNAKDVAVLPLIFKTQSELLEHRGMTVLNQRLTRAWMILHREGWRGIHTKEFRRTRLRYVPISGTRGVGWDGRLRAVVSFRDDGRGKDRTLVELHKLTVSPSSPSLSVIWIGYEDPEAEVLATLSSAGRSEARRVLDSVGGSSWFPRRRKVPSQDPLPPIQAWAGQAWAKMKVQGWLTNPFSRRRWFGSKQRVAAVRFLVQSTAADCLMLSVEDVAEAMKAVDGRLLAIEGCGLWLEVPSAALGTVKEAVRVVLDRQWEEIGPGFKLSVARSKSNG